MTSDIITLVTGLLVQALLLGAGGVWKLTRVEVSIRGALAKNRQETDDKINVEVGKLRAELRDDHEEFSRQWGDGLLAMRTKITEVELASEKKFAGIELWNRDNFVRRDDFGAIISGISRSIDGLRAELGAAKASIEEKIEKVREAKSGN